MVERKYIIKDGKVVKRSDEVPIPDDEPLFILRAQDIKALPVLLAYLMIQNTLEMRTSVKESIEDFRRFAEKNPDRMKNPD